MVPARADFVPYSETLHAAQLNQAVTKHDPYLEAVCTYTPTDVEYFHWSACECCPREAGYMQFASPALGLLHHAWLISQRGGVRMPARAVSIVRWNWCAMRGSMVPTRA